MNLKTHAAAMLVLAGMIMPMPAIGFNTLHLCSNKVTGDLRAVPPAPNAGQTKTQCI
jgi:hypothetical protein